MKTAHKLAFAFASLIITTHASAFRPDGADQRPGLVLDDDPVPATQETMRDSETVDTTEISTSGDILEIQAGEVVPVRKLAFPKRGMKKQRVMDELGIPETVTDAVGEPPITRWVYKDRTVYFEFDSVVHVVSRR